MTKMHVVIRAALCFGLVFILFVFLSLVIPPLFHKNFEATLSESTETFGESETECCKERVLNIENNDEALVWRLRLIGNAKSELILTTFELCDDRSGREIMSALYDASERGVKVRILVDGFSAFARLKQSDCFKALVSSANVEAKYYNAVNLLTPWNLNYRMHDKFLIADGFAYILGGRNTNDLFLGNYRENYNIDRDVLVYSENVDKASVNDVKAYFEELWGLSCCTSVEYDVDHSELVSAKNKLVDLFYELKQDRPEAFETVDWIKETFEANRVHLISNSVNVGNKAPELWYSLNSLMKNGNQILVQTPYIIFGNEMYSDFKALTDEGKSVSVMTNSVANGANPWGCSDYLNHKNRIYASGVGVYEFLGGQSLHTKTVLIDNSISIVGSFNMDMRSAYLDTETMLVIDCPELNSRLKNSFYKATDVSRFVNSSTVSYGKDYVERELPYFKRAFLTVFRIIIKPFRYLL